MRRLAISLKGDKLQIMEYHNESMILLTEVGKKFFDSALAMAEFISIPFYTLPEWQERNEPQ
jgi:hypothetical protein